jgi:23S rRNA (uracil1939-C5)-methyltransferase
MRVTVRVATSGEVSVDLWTAPGPFPRAVFARVIGEATGARTVTRVIARGKLERRDIANVEVLAGPGAWAEKLDSDRYLVSAPSFFQANTAAAELLRRAALEMLALDGTMRAADLYAGVGTFTLPMARAAGDIVAVEGSRFALNDLRRNAERADVHVDVVPGDAAHALGELGHLDAALVDPPRSGLSENAIRALLDARIERIVYVSCDPATLARDLHRLAAGGYAARRFQAFDLFPQTYHLETVALLERD